MDIFVSWNNNSGSRMKSELTSENRELGTQVKGSYKSPGKNNKDLISRW